MSRLRLPVFVALRAEPAGISGLVSALAPFNAAVAVNQRIRVVQHTPSSYLINARRSGNAHLYLAVRHQTVFDRAIGGITSSNGGSGNWDMWCMQSWQEANTRGVGWKEGPRLLRKLRRFVISASNNGPGGTKHILGVWGAKHLQAAHAAVAAAVLGSPIRAPWVFAGDAEEDLVVADYRPTNTQTNNDTDPDPDVLWP